MFIQLLATSAILVSCTSSQKVEPMKQGSDKSTQQGSSDGRATPPATTGQGTSTTQNQQPVTPQTEVIPDGDGFRRRDETPPILPPPTNTQPPAVEPPPTVVTPPVKPESTSQGDLSFNAILFVNMEHDQHATDADNMAVLKDSSGNVLAAGDMTLAAAAVHGENNSASGGAYPVTKVKVALSQVAQNAPASGQGTLSVCPVNKAERSSGTFNCASTDPVNNERPVVWNSKPVSFTKSGSQFQVNNQAYGNGNDVRFGLSYSHAFTMGAVAASAAPFVDASSPIVLDLNRNETFDLTSAMKSKVRFDLEAKGPAAVAHGWIEKGDALLALDINGNGKIDDGSELFGEYSYSLVEKKASRFKNGFDALAQYDDNKDGKIDSSDKIFEKLLVWTDSNGVSEASELRPLSRAKIASLSLKFSATGETFHTMMVAGNEVRYLSSFKMTDGRFYNMADVWFTKHHAQQAQK